jgi:hypothetical protein
MSTIIVKEMSGAGLEISGLSVPDAELPAGGQITLTDYNTVIAIQSDRQLQDYIQAGTVILNDGTADLTQEQSLNISAPVASAAETVSPMASDPPDGAPGDTYFNTALGLWMFYDDTRVKWLSREVWCPVFSHDRADNSYLQVGDVTLSSSRGYWLSRDATICELAYTRRQEATDPTFEVRRNGSSTGADLFSPNNRVGDSDKTLDVDVNQNGMLQVFVDNDRCREPVVWLKLRWRA